MGKGKISSEVLFWLVYAATKVLKNSSKKKIVVSGHITTL